MCEAVCGLSPQSARWCDAVTADLVPTVKNQLFHDHANPTQ